MTIQDYIANIPGHERECRTFSLVEHSDLLEWQQEIEQLRKQLALAQPDHEAVEMLRSGKVECVSIRKPGRTWVAYRDILADASSDGARVADDPADAIRAAAREQ